MAMVDYLVVMAKSFFEEQREVLHIGTEDMQGAYRQIPLPNSQVGIVATAVYNPHVKQVNLVETDG